jgi:hypothetical protein
MAAGERQPKLTLLSHFFPDRNRRSTTFRRPSLRRSRLSPHPLRPLIGPEDYSAPFFPSPSLGRGGQGVRACTCGLSRMCGWEPHLRKTVVVAYFVGAARSSASPVHPVSRGPSRTCGWEPHLRKTVVVAYFVGAARSSASPVHPVSRGPSRTCGWEPHLRKTVVVAYFVGAARSSASPVHPMSRGPVEDVRLGAAPTEDRRGGVFRRRCSQRRFAGSSRVSGPVEDVRLGAAPTKNYHDCVGAARSCASPVSQILRSPFSPSPSLGRGGQGVRAYLVPPKDFCEDFSMGSAVNEQTGSQTLNLPFISLLHLSRIMSVGR